MARDIQLDELAALAPAVTANMANFYIENCRVSFELHDHQTGVEMDVRFIETNESSEVHWTGNVTEQMRNAYLEREKRVDFAACAIALLLLPEYAKMYAVMPSAKNNGIDYFLANEQEVHLIFNHSAVLEVSGIQTEQGSNTVTRRIREKRDRLRQYENSNTSTTVDLPTFICVVEFSHPKARVVKV